MSELIIFIFLSLIILTGGYFWEKEACNQRAISFEAHEYGLFSGCMVKHNGKWLPIDNIRGFDDKG